MDTQTYIDEIAARGGETSIFSTPWGRGRSAGFEIPLAVADEWDGLILLRCEGWRYYSRRVGVKRAVLAYLAGIDDNGPWAVRVPGTLSGVAEALDWHTPVEVHKARREGRYVFRQGDVWVVSKSRRGRDDASTGAGLPASHRVSVRKDGSRWLLHEPRPGERKHRALWLPRGPVGFAVGRRLETRRGGAAD